MTQDAIAEKYKINRSLVSKWVKDKKKITAAAATAHKKLLKIRPGNKYSRLFSLLMTRFKNARSKGYGVDFNWLWSKARVAYREQACNHHFLEEAQHKNAGTSEEQEGTKARF